MHFDPDQLDWQPIGDGWQRAVLKLGKGDSAWNPASTKPERSIYGPATVTYERAPDGGVTAHVAPGPRFTDAEKAALRRTGDAIRKGLS